MAGFADLPVGDTSMFAAAPVQTPQTPKKVSGGGGLFGFVRKNLIDPTVNAVSAIPSDVIHAGEALGTVGGSILSGHHGAQLAADKQKALDQIRGTTAGKSLPSTVAAVQAQPIGQQLEQVVGNTGTQILNATAPLAGGGSLAGKVGFKALTTAGAKMGAKLGAAGGVTNAMAEGQNAEQIVGAGGTGALFGAGTGATGNIIGSTVGKLTGKATQNSINSGGLLSKSANKAGERAATAEKAAQAVDFAGATPTDIKNTMSYDKGGKPIGFAQVSSFMRGLKVPANAQNMEATHDFLTGSIGGNLKDITDSVATNMVKPDSIAEEAIRKNRGLLGQINRNGSGAAADTLNHVVQATEGITEGSPVSDVLTAISQLEGARGDLNHSISMGNTVAKGQDAVYKTVIDNLHKTLDSAGVNKAVTSFKVTPELEQAIHSDAAQTGVSPEMAQHVIDTLNNSKSYSDLRSAMQPGVVAGKLSRVAKETFSNHVPKEGKSTNPGLPSWEVAASLHNPAYLAAGAAKLAGKSGAVDSGLSKINPKSFNAGREGVLAPDEATAQKLAQPGGGPATLPESTPATPAQTSSITGSLQKMGVPVTTAIAGQAANQVGQNANVQNDTQAAPIETPVQNVNDNVTDTTNQPGIDASSIPGGTLEDLQAEIQADPKNAAIYKQVYDEAQKQVSASTPSPTQLKNQSAIKNAQATLDQIKQSFKAAGGGQGKLSGTVQSLLGNSGMNSNVATYNDTATALAASLYKALGNTGTISDRDQAMIAKLIPKITDSQTTADAKVAQLENLLEQASSNTSIDQASPTVTASNQSIGVQ